MPNPEPSSPDIDWTRAFAYQAQRTLLVEDWFDALGLGLGVRFADLGSGPGYVSLRAARRVGPHGRVYAVDHAPGAATFLQQIIRLHDLPQIECITADLKSLEQLPTRVDAALLAMTLHHDGEPAAILRQAARLIGPDRPIVIAEFDPCGPCEIGPPATARLSPATIADWCDQAGIRPTEPRRQTSEHWFMLARTLADGAENRIS